MDFDFVPQIPTNPQPNGDPQLAYKNNNPGNLKYAGQPGALPGVGGFARFASPVYGAQALHDQIALDQSRNLTLSQFVNKYAPPGDNDTALYLQQAAKALGTQPNVSISKLDRAKLAAFVAQKESGTDLSKFTPQQPKSWLDPYIPTDQTATAGVLKVPPVGAAANFIRTVLKPR